MGARICTAAFMDVGSVPGLSFLVLGCHGRKWGAHCNLELLPEVLSEAHHPHTQEVALCPYFPAGQVQVHYLGSSSLSIFIHLFTNTNTEILTGKPPRTLAPSTFPSLHHHSHFPSLEQLPCSHVHSQIPPNSQQLVLLLQTL